MRIEIIEVPGERIIECPRHSGTGVAIIELRRSRPHRHIRTSEQYVLLSGIVDVHHGETTTRLAQFGDDCTIPEGVIHWASAVGDAPAILAVYSTPPWTKDDHHLVELEPPR
jgi:mannose-6-phosphate isomerase-like protein (cupin superfamily)